MTAASGRRHGVVLGLQLSTNQKALGETLFMDNISEPTLMIPVSACLRRQMTTLLCVEETYLS